MTGPQRAALPYGLERWVPFGWVPAAVLTLILGLYRLDAKGIWFDERVSLELATGDWVQFADRTILGDQTFGMLHYSLLRLWTTFGQDLYTIRLLSVVFAVATIPVLYAVALRVAGPLVALLATLVLSGNAYFIHYAQEARAYMLAMLLVTLATLLLLRLFDQPTPARWLAYGVAAVGALFAHFFAGFVLVVHLAAVIQRGMLSRRVLVGLAVALLLAIPLGWFVAFGGSPRRFIEPITETTLISAIRDVTGGLPERTLHAYAYLAAATAGACLLKPRWSAYFLIAWLLVPWVLVIGVGLGWRPLLVPRYMIVTLPALVILVAAGIAALRPRWLMLPILIGFLLLSIQGLGWWYYDATKGRERSESPAPTVIQASWRHRASASPTIVAWSGTTEKAPAEAGAFTAVVVEVD